ncbi:MAG: ATP-binding protein [Spirochaetes bacterium]|nr:ATP-binding protein [Spirochaetota bacterium]
MIFTRTGPSNRPTNLGSYFIYRTALVMILLFAVITLITLLLIRKNIKEQLLSLQKSATQILAEEARVRGASLKIVLQTAATYWASGTFSTALHEGFQSFGHALIQSEPSLLSFWIVDGSTGKVKGATPMNRAILGYDCSYLLPKTQHSSRPFYWSSIGLNPFFANPVFSLSLEAGKDLCIGWIDPQLFLQDFTLPRYGEAHFLDVFACDNEGNLVVHREPRFVIRRENIRTIPAVRNTLDGNVPSLSIVESSIFGEGRMIVTTAPVEESRWVVGVVQEEKRIQIQPLTLLSWGIAFLAFFSLLSLLTARQVSRLLCKELQPFTESIEAISKGTYSLPLPPQRFKELETLRVAFQSMAEAVQEREKQLAESSIFIRTVLDTIPVEVFWKDLDLKYRGCNRRFLQDTGKKTTESLVGLDDYAMPWKDQAELYRSEDRSVIQSGEAKIGLEHSHTLADGTRVWHLTTKIPLKNTEGTIIGVLGTTIDITPLKEREEEIKALNAELERRVRERTEDLQKANEELRNVLTNLSRTQDRLLQAEKLSVLGRLSAGIAHELNTPLGAILSSTHSLSQLMEHFIEKELPYFYSLPEEDRVFYLWVFKTIRSTPAFTNLLTEEESSLFTNRLREAGVYDPEEALELLEDLSPSISAYLDILLPALKDPHRRELLHHVSQSLNLFRSILVIDLAAQKASSVVQALRRYLKAETPIERGIVEIERDIETVLVLLQNRIKDGVRIVRKYGGVQAWGSSAQLTQVWLNLINNALQAMNYEGELILETKQEGSFVSVSIIDNGPGIPEEIKPFIFEPFFTTKKQEEGIGIGLEICRSIVREHGGSITFESSPGRTRFTVTLASFDPAVPPHTSCT